MHIIEMKYIFVTVLLSYSYFFLKQYNNKTQQLQQQLKILFFSYLQITKCRVTIWHIICISYHYMYLYFKPYRYISSSALGNCKSIEYSFGHVGLSEPDFSVFFYLGKVDSDSFV